MKPPVISAIIPGTVSNYHKQKETEAKPQFHSPHWEPLRMEGGEVKSQRDAVF